MERLQTMNWAMKFSGQLRTKFTVYRVANRLKAKELIDEVIENYLDGVSNGQAPVDEKIREYDDLEKWCINIDKELYKRLKILSVAKECYIYEMAATAFYRFLESKNYLS